MLNAVQEEYGTQNGVLWDTGGNRQGLLPFKENGPGTMQQEQLDPGMHACLPGCHRTATPEAAENVHTAERPTKYHDGGINSPPLDKRMKEAI
jgi:hypothetical protein